jgi:8-oxo-dGTP diphosphatase
MSTMNTNSGAWMVIYCKPKQTFLFGKRGTKKRKSRLWDLFGGHLEPDEDPRSGVLREVREEAGLDLTDSRIIPYSSEGYGTLGFFSGIRTMYYYLMVTAEEFAPTLDYEHSAYGWYRLDALPHRVNRPTAIARNIGLFVKALAMADDGSFSGRALRTP